MLKRRKFIQQSIVLLGLRILRNDKLISDYKNDSDLFSFKSKYINVQLFRDRPQFSFFTTDSLGKGEFGPNLMLGSIKKSGQKLKSQIKNKSILWLKNQYPIWGCNFKDRNIVFSSSFKEGNESLPFDMIFSQEINHCTVLGTMKKENQIELPCILHFPNIGTFKITSKSNPKLAIYYDADRTNERFVKISLPPATSGIPSIQYNFESVIIYPEIKQIESSSQYDGFKKNFINIFQLNPRRKVLSNNSASDNCAFTLFLYAEMAKNTPLLTENMSAMDLIRNTLDEYLNGTLGYGMLGYHIWKSEYDSSDSYPSLVISACYYILKSKDYEWAKVNYNGIKKWAKKIVAKDRNGDGIIEYEYSGNSGSWDGVKRPANWWDTIGFGHNDAYSNALAYRSLVLLSDVANLLREEQDYHFFLDFSKRLKDNYYPMFFNPKTGVLGGWRSSDGALHDYYFTFVNAIAICYDLIDIEAGKKIMKNILKRMKEVGYNNFEFGLPGNLVPIEEKDYTDKNPRFGFNNFQVYENGGATGCYVYYTIHALFKLGFRSEAEEILNGMLNGYRSDSFSGFCKDNNQSKDWKKWNGECTGYEGFLVDNYLALLNVLDYFGLNTQE